MKNNDDTEQYKYPERINVLGVGICAVNIPIVLKVVDEWIQKKVRTYICVTGVHGVIESQRKDKIKNIHNEAGLVVPDSRPMFWAGKLRGYKHMGQVHGFDLTAAICEHSVDKGYRHFFYGAAEGVPEKMKQNLQEKYPGLQVVGTYSPPFRAITDKEEIEISSLINNAKPDIVWVGLSTPKQELWMGNFRDKLDAPVLIGVGAAFDFYAGLIERAPNFMKICGMEWLYRLVKEPKRLAKRYLINNPYFAWLLILQLLKLKKFNIRVTNQ